MAHEELGDGIIDEFGRFGDEEVANRHQKIGAIDGFEDVFVIDAIDTPNFFFFHLLLKRLEFSIFVEECGGFDGTEFGKHLLIDVFMVAEVDEQSDFAFSYIGKEVRDHVEELLKARSRSPNGKEDTKGLPSKGTFLSSLIVLF
jgi:hypothetical protein